MFSPERFLLVASESHFFKFILRLRDPAGVDQTKKENLIQIRLPKVGTVAPEPRYQRKYCADVRATG